MSLKHVMLDLETWGVGPYSVIIMIGACVFDPYAELPVSNIILDRFEVAIDPALSQGSLRIEASTVMWWMATERTGARAIWLGSSKVSLLEALDGFTDWLQSHSADTGDGGCRDVRVWGNGAGFDNILLRQAYEVTKRDAPWSFRHDRCFRTLRSMTPEDKHYLGPAHTALADAENQAIRANQIVRKLGLKLT
jgi:exodeoxyribonuclease VIII